jgi:hypothetical protein
MINEAEITAYIAQTFPGVAVISAPGGSFYFYDPEGDTPEDRRLPFVTVTIKDDYDTASNLARPDVFRFNIGVSKETFHTLFDRTPAATNGTTATNTAYDYTALDVILPHPVYAPQSWVCVLNPGPATIEEVKRLLAEAYEMAVRKHDKQTKHKS